MKNKKKTAAVGIDIGGGSIKMGLVDPSGRILRRSSFLTKSAKSRTELFDMLSAHAEDLMREGRAMGFQVRGVGIGAPGPIDVERGFVYFFPNIPGWKDTPLKGWLEKRLRVPVLVDNDANVMTLAEYRFGAGRGATDMIALTLGTGVGGGLVIGDRLFHGPVFSAAEIGHLPINEDGPVCGCGNRGCIETYVGSGYFTARLRRGLDEGKKSILRDWVKKGEELTPLLAAKAARKGDAYAIGVWRETAAHLATALTGLVNILNPRRIVLGGGIAQNGTLLSAPLTALLKKKAFPIAARSVKVVPAKLGVDAGLVGAAALVFQSE